MRAYLKAERIIICIVAVPRDPNQGSVVDLPHILGKPSGLAEGKCKDQILP